MSQENVEIVRAAIEAFNRGDLDAALSDAAVDLEYDLSRAMGPIRGVYRFDRVHEVMAEFVDIWTWYCIEPHEFIEADDLVVVPWTFRARGRGQVEVQARVTWTFTMRDGLIQRMRMYQERREALEAAGLSD